MIIKKENNYFKLYPMSKEDIDFIKNCSLQGQWEEDENKLEYFKIIKR